ncbi:Uncharacterised protein [Mycobacteroides abscessus subsp. abscessus]|nr:Uncharacterised protein [Mycobacteroides abscessus subsp. abscessus]
MLREGVQQGTLLAPRRGELMSRDDLGELHQSAQLRVEQHQRAHPGNGQWRESTSQAVLIF